MSVQTYKKNHRCAGRDEVFLLLKGFARLLVHARLQESLNQVLWNQGWILGGRYSDSAWQTGQPIEVRVPWKNFSRSKFIFWAVTKNLSEVNNTVELDSKKDSVPLWFLQYQATLNYDPVGQVPTENDQKFVFVPLSINERFHHQLSVIWILNLCCPIQRLRVITRACICPTWGKKADGYDMCAYPGLICRPVWARCWAGNYRKGFRAPWFFPDVRTYWMTCRADLNEEHLSDFWKPFSES